MKTLTVSEANGRLAELIAAANQGELVILKSGEHKVTLYPGAIIDASEDSPELEAELLKGIDEPITPYSAEEIHAACQEAAARLRKK